MDMLKDGVSKITDSDSFRAHLDAQAKFWTYSPKNTILILMQNPQAQRVASYDTWQALGRQVSKGEKGIKIFFPLIRAVKQENENGEIEQAKVLTGFGLGNVFDVSQTTGRPIPTPPEVPILDSQAGGELYDRLAQVAEDDGLGIDVWSDSIPNLPHAVGCYEPHRKRISHVKLSPLMETKVLAHELGHYYHGEELFTSSREEQETLAESTAYVVLRHSGYDSGERSFPYIANWIKNPDQLSWAMAKIHRLSSLLIGKAELVGASQPVKEAA